MDSIGSEVGQKMRSAIKAKLMELGCYVDDELPDYIMVMVANKRSRSQMVDDLQLFLRSDTEIFVEWLQQVLKKLKQVTITNPEVCGSFRELKRKAALEIAECVIKKEKKEKKLKADKKTRTIELSEEKSITDEIPVQATKLLGKRNQIRLQENLENKTDSQNDEIQSTNPVEIVNENNFDIPSIAEVNDLQEEQLDIVETKIKEARNRIVLMQSDSEDEDFINIRADAEELMDNELDSTNVVSSEFSNERTVTLSKEDDEILSNSKVQTTKSLFSERIGSQTNNNLKDVKNSPNDKTIESSGKIKSSIQSIVKKPPENKIQKKESVHKRLGLPSSVVNLTKKIGSDNQSKSLMSVVQVKPRRNVSGLCQANKNLLLKAVAEAQKSVKETPLVGKKNKEKEALFTKNYREKYNMGNNNVEGKSSKEDDPKVQNIIIEVKRNKKKQSNDEDVEENSTSVSKDSESNEDDHEYMSNAIDLTYEEDLDKYMEDFEANTSHNSEEIEKEEPNTNHQFIVTLDGLNDKNLLKPNENPTETVQKPIKKPPSPIIFDKIETSKAEKSLTQIPEKLPKVHLPLSVKIKERCKYWPSCRLKETCEYAHPNTPCNLFPGCKFGDKCLYIHPKCKFDASCTRKDCPYSHARVKLKPVPRLVTSYVLSQEVCKYHPNCSNAHCTFYHPKLCRFGKYCLNKSECSFSHGKIPNKGKLTWHSNIR